MKAQAMLCLATSQIKTMETMGSGGGLMILDPHSMTITISNFRKHVVANGTRILVIESFIGI